MSRAVTPRSDFDQGLAMIEPARTHAVAGVNIAIINLYWSIGENISRNLTGDGWGKGMVKALAVSPCEGRLANDTQRFQRMMKPPFSITPAGISDTPSMLTMKGL